MLITQMIALILSVLLFGYIGYVTYNTLKQFRDVVPENRKMLFRESGQTFFIMGILLLVWSAFLEMIT